MSTDAQREEQARLLIESNKELYAAVEFSIEARRFLESTIGKYLVQRAEAERDEAISDLVNCSAMDIERIRDLQSTIKRAESIQYWMAEIIQLGAHAQSELLAQDRASSDEADQ